jgi:hypothetical protein
MSFAETVKGGTKAANEGTNPVEIHPNVRHA